VARIRTIKPEFFTSEDIVSLSPMARLLYIALWCEADREGRLEWKPNTFKFRYLPADDCDVGELCDELIARGLVVLYGQGLAYIPKFSTHQHINPREAASNHPTPTGQSRENNASGTRGARVDDASGTRQARDSDAQGGREGKGKERKEEKAGGGESSTVALIPLDDGTDYAVRQDSVDEFTAAYPRIDVAAELAKARAWCLSNPKNRKTRSGAQRFLNSWLSRANDRSAATSNVVDLASQPGGGRRRLG
jgi:hypothetical protein